MLRFPDRWSHPPASFAALTVIAGLLVPATGHAGTLTWSATGTSSAIGGTGTWDTTNARWTADGTTWSPWVNSTSDTAVFAGTAGTVTLGTGITAGGLTFDTTGYTITGNTLTLAGTTAAITTNADATSIASTISGTAAFEKLGSGTVTLTGTNSFTGGLVINVGRVVLNQNVGAGGGNGTAGGAGSITVNAAATLANGAGNSIWGGVLNTRTVTVNQGTIDLTLGQEYFYALDMTGGEVTRGGSGNLFRTGSQVGAGTINVTASGFDSLISTAIDMTQNSLTLNVADGSLAHDLRITGVISQTGAKSITKNGAGTVLLTASNTYSGGTVINAGTLVAGHANALGTTGTISVGANGTFGVADEVSFSRSLTLASGARVRAGNESSVVLPSAAALAAWESTSPLAGATAAEILFGNGGAGGSRTLASAWFANPGGNAASDILDLAGTGPNTTWVLSLSYDPGVADLSLLNIFSRPGTTGDFAPVGQGDPTLGAWTSSFTTPGQYGIDTTSQTVWVVTDTNSQFVVMAVPEPGTLALAAIGIAAAIALRRRTL
jgi:fibronectin-binding autotransporter adhesin